MSERSDARTPSRVAVIGASGLVGRALISQLLSDAEIREIHLLLRTPLTDLPADTRLQQHRIDPLRPASWQPFLNVDALFCALGTTIKAAGSETAFRAVDYQLVLSVAQQAKRAGVRHLLVVSALGANAHSSVFYNRVKGEMEQALRALQLPKLSLFRPSLLAGPRREFRLGERLALLVAWLLPARWRAISDVCVAHAMWRVSRDQQEAERIYESAEMQQLGRY